MDFLEGRKKVDCNSFSYAYTCSHKAIVKLIHRKYDGRLFHTNVFEYATAAAAAVQCTVFRGCLLQPKSPMMMEQLRPWPFFWKFGDSA